MKWSKLIFMVRFIIDTGFSRYIFGSPAASTAAATNKTVLVNKLRNSF